MHAVACSELFRQNKLKEKVGESAEWIDIAV